LKETRLCGINDLRVLTLPIEATLELMLDISTELSSDVGLMLSAVTDGALIAVLVSNDPSSSCLNGCAVHSLTRILLPLCAP
jgi:hypothetical protein